MLLHSAVRAHASRVLAIDELYTALEADSGTAVREARQRLSALICAWSEADLAAERADLVPLDPDPTLKKLFTRLPERLPRATMIRIRRSLARLAVFKSGIFFENELELIRKQLDWESERAASLRLDPEKNFQATFEWAIHACLIREPGANGARDLGIGEIPRADERLLPPGRFGQQNHFEGTGPIAWAAGDDLAAFLSAMRSDHAPLAERLHEATAIVAWIEDRPPESDGDPIWLIAID